MNLKLFLSSLVCCLVITSSPLLSHNITVIGIGRLGLCVALSLEKAGHNVVGVDISPEYVAKLNNKNFFSSEPQVEEYLRKSKNFRATSDLSEGLAFSDFYFINVCTTRGEDAYDFSQLEALLVAINERKVSNKNIVINSTLFPGYINDQALPLLKNCQGITVSYNAPFIAQGDIINGYTKPDMVLIGQANQKMGDILEEIYRDMCPNNPFIARMSVESAEITKLALNCYITMKIAFANLVGDIADSTPNADKVAILNAVGNDTRVGLKYLRSGYGFGGPCFPRDNRGLGRFARSKGIEPVLFEATDNANKQHAEFMAKQFLDENREEYVFEDVSYKPNSPVKILEESQKLAVAKKIAQAGKKVIIVDCKAIIDQLKAQFGTLFLYRIV